MEYESFSLDDIFYILQQDLKWQVDGNLLAKMEANNKVSSHSQTINKQLAQSLISL